MNFRVNSEHVFGCLDLAFCCILNLGLWLEVFHGTVSDGRNRPFVFAFTDEINNAEKAADRIKAKLARVLRPVLKRLNMESVLEGLLGTHSVRKFASSYARGNGIQKDDKDHRGRWKRKMRVSDVYDDIELNYVDASVAAVLSPAGVCHYVVIDPACTSAWIAANITPNIEQVFGPVLATLFGKAILWLAFSEHKDLLPHAMLGHIQEAYANRATLEDGTNPVERRLVYVSGNQGAVNMETVQPEQLEGNNVNANVMPTNNVSGGGSRQLLLSVIANQHALQRAFTEQKTAIENVRGTISRQGQTLNSVLRKIDSNPTRLLQQAAVARQQYTPARQEVDTNRAPNARLVSNPRTLHQLWDEYEHGIAGAKPAKFFTRAERGAYKCKYSRRKKVWDLIDKLIRRGHTAGRAIELLHNAYGASSSVTTIINNLRKDMKNNTLPPNLR